MLQVLVILLFVFCVAGRLPQAKYDTLNEFNGVCSALYGVHFNNFAWDSSENPNHFEKDFIKFSPKDLNDHYTTEFKFGHLPKKFHHKIVKPFQEKSAKLNAEKELQRILKDTEKEATIEATKHEIKEQVESDEIKEQVESDEIKEQVE
eukprot:Platyproteum_vivax@DN9634_c0_g1_i1.p1